MALHVCKHYNDGYLYLVKSGWRVVDDCLGRDTVDGHNNMIKYRIIHTVKPNNCIKKHWHGRPKTLIPHVPYLTHWLGMPVNNNNKICLWSGRLVWNYLRFFDSINLLLIPLKPLKLRIQTNAYTVHTPGL